MWCSGALGRCGDLHDHAHVPWRLPVPARDQISTIDLALDGGFVPLVRALRVSDADDRDDANDNNDGNDGGAGGKGALRL